MHRCAKKQRAFGTAASESSSSDDRDAQAAAVETWVLSTGRQAAPTASNHKKGRLRIRCCEKTGAAAKFAKKQNLNRYLNKQWCASRPFHPSFMVVPHDPASTEPAVVSRSPLPQRRRGSALILLHRCHVSRHMKLCRAPTRCLPLLLFRCRPHLKQNSSNLTSVLLRRHHAQKLLLQPHLHVNISAEAQDRQSGNVELDEHSSLKDTSRLVRGTIATTHRLRGRGEEQVESTDSAPPLQPQPPPADASQLADNTAENSPQLECAAAVNSRSEVDGAASGPDTPPTRVELGGAVCAVPPGPTHRGTAPPEPKAPSDAEDEHAALSELANEPEPESDAPCSCPPSCIQGEANKDDNDDDERIDHEDLSRRTDVDERLPPPSTSYVQVDNGDANHSLGPPTYGDVSGRIDVDESESLCVAPLDPTENYAGMFSCIEDFLICPSTLSPFPTSGKSVDFVKLFRELQQLAGDILAATADVRKEWLQEQDASQLCFYKVQQSRPEVYDLVTRVLEESTLASGAPWEEVDVPLWNLWWTWRKPLPKERVWLRSQWVNHIPKSSQITSKERLKANVQRYRKGKSHMAALFDIIPLTFTLPKEYVAFAQCFAELRGLWIMKPVGMSRGRGIVLLSDISDVVYTSPMIVQRYIDRPFLIDGFKFDLRLYVVVTQFHPLEAFLSRLGLTRIASRRYSTNEQDRTNRQIHLTNTAVSNDAKTGGASVERTDNKWPLEKLRAYLEQHSHARWDVLWSNVCETVLRALVCAEPNIPNCSCSFELFGFDILIDETMKPWVLEVNASPQLDIYTSIDEAVKPQLLRDIVNLLNPLPHDYEAIAACTQQYLAGREHKSFYASRVDFMNRHLSRILMGRKLRRYGEVPDNLGHFDVLAPSANYTKISKQKHAV